MDCFAQCATDASKDLSTEAVAITLVAITGMFAYLLVFKSRLLIFSLIWMGTMWLAQRRGDTEADVKKFFNLWWFR